MSHHHAVPERTTLLEMPPLPYTELGKPSFWPVSQASTTSHQVLLAWCQVHFRRVHCDLQSLYSLNAVENQWGISFYHVVWTYTWGPNNLWALNSYFWSFSGLWLVRADITTSFQNCEPWACFWGELHQSAIQQSMVERSYSVLWQILLSIYSTIQNQGKKTFNKKSWNCMSVAHLLCPSW